ncbi:MAG TPA: hypothetical protein PKE57_00910 [Cellvibrionaceae bacterium]|nr:hypothetical protein [Cellvibrionaceae bacterium]HMW47636.1 hypothetical protein [Cellvibrionaceae bacterium]HMW72262.1 hypothetical protein [Cellvibrionaceae bacterium]HNG59691.1 hypothetical protein [Cellvibrionaceae bacterium]
MRFCFILLLLLNAHTALSAQALRLDTNSNIEVVFPDKNPVIFVGKKSLDKSANNGGGIMYPGDTAGLFLVSVLTHAAISGAAQSSAEKKEQELANQVLAPFADIIKEVDMNFLWDEQRIRAADPKLHDLVFNTQKSAIANSWSLDTKPVFALTQSKASLILYNKINLECAGDGSKKKSKNRSKKKPAESDGLTVVIISDPIIEENKTDYWLRNSGSAFKNEIKRLFTLSIGMAIQSARDEVSISSLPEVSVRYLQDGLKYLERGQIITQDCRRTVFKTLSNELKSVPNLDFTNCPQT